MTRPDVDLLLSAEITLFFERNPFTMETAEGLARKLGRRADQVSRALKLLAAKRILNCEEPGNLYTYSPPFVNDRT